MPQSKLLVSSTHKRGGYLRQLNNRSCAAWGLKICLINCFYKDKEKSGQANVGIIQNNCQISGVSHCPAFWWLRLSEQFLGFGVMGREWGSSTPFVVLKLICGFENTVWSGKVGSQKEFVHLVSFHGLSGPGKSSPRTLHGADISQTAPWGLHWGDFCPGEATASSLNLQLCQAAPFREPVCVPVWFLRFQVMMLVSLPL